MSDQLSSETASSYSTMSKRQKREDPPEEEASQASIQVKKSGQYAATTSIIASVVKDYPSENVLKEFVQNAEDAGATKFELCIDGRTFPSGTLFDKALKPFQGPSLVFFNSGQFTQKDFKKINALFKGSKQRKEGQIGRRGLGFRSVYNMTDMPSVLSGTSLLVQDPRMFLRDAPKKWNTDPKGGITLENFGPAAARYADQFAPFVAHGFTGTTFNGTLIRAPLRTELLTLEQEDEDEDDEEESDNHISHNVWDVDRVEQVLRPVVMQELPEYLVFLKHVAETNVFKVSADGKTTTNLAKTTAVRSEAVATAGGGEAVVVKIRQTQTSQSVSEGGMELETVLFEKTYELEKVGSATVAAPAISSMVMEQEDGSSSACPKQSSSHAHGVFYAGLPIRGLRTSCALSVHSLFHVAADRKTLLINDDTQGAGERETRENRAALADAARAAARLIAKRTAATQKLPLQLFPRYGEHKEGQTFSQIFFEDVLREYPHCLCDLRGKALRDFECLLITEDEASTKTDLVAALRAVGAPVVIVDAALMENLLQKFHAEDRKSRTATSASTSGGSSASVRQDEEPQNDTRETSRDRSSSSSAAALSSSSSPCEVQASPGGACARARGTPQRLTRTSLQQWLRRQAKKVPSSRFWDHGSASASSSATASIGSRSSGSPMDATRSTELKLVPVQSDMSSSLLEMEDGLDHNSATAASEKNLRHAMSLVEYFLEQEGALDDFDVASSLEGLPLLATSCGTITSFSSDNPITAPRSVLEEQVTQHLVSGKVVHRDAQKLFRDNFSRLGPLVQGLTCEVVADGLQQLKRTPGVYSKDASLVASGGELGTGVVAVEPETVTALCAWFDSAFELAEKDAHFLSNIGVWYCEGVDAPLPFTDFWRVTSPKHVQHVRVLGACGIRVLERERTPAIVEQLARKLKDVALTAPDTDLLAALHKNVTSRVRCSSDHADDEEEQEDVERAAKRRRIDDQTHSSSRLEWEALRNFLAELLTGPASGEREGGSFLMLLPLFENFENSRLQYAGDFEHVWRPTEAFMTLPRVDELRRAATATQALYSAEKKVVELLARHCGRKELTLLRDLVITHKLVEPAQIQATMKDALRESEEVFTLQELQSLEFVPTQGSTSTGRGGGFALPSDVVLLSPEIREQFPTICRAADFLLHPEWTKDEQVLGPRLLAIGVRKELSAGEVKKLCEGLRDKGHSVENRTRAESVEEDPTCLQGGNELDRSRKLLLELGSYVQTTASLRESEALMKFLKSFPCVPTANAPKNSAWMSFAPWYSSGSGKFGRRPTDVALAEQGDLVGAVQPVADCEFNRELLHRLGGVGSPRNEISRELVRQQLTAIVRHERSETDLCPETLLLLTSVLDKIYRFLDAEDFSHERLPQKWIWAGERERFVAPEVVCMDPVMKSAEPVVVVLEKSWSGYAIFQNNLCAAVEKDPSFLAAALRRISAQQKERRENPGSVKFELPSSERTQIEVIVNALERAVTKSCTTRDSKSKGEGPALDAPVDILLPQANGFLVPAAETIVDDMPWLRKSEDQAAFRQEHVAHFLFDSIAPKVGEGLGATLLSQKGFGSSLVQTGSHNVHDLGCVEAAGQGESFTQTLRRICDDYSASAMLKEVLQNANDSGLKSGQIRVLVDWRSHANKSCLAPPLARLQGPRLILFNDGVWEEEDFRGVLNTGLGSKRDKGEAWGQFGLGFNVLYHYGDVIMVLSRNFLQVLDPSVTYTQQLKATRSNPGARIDLEHADNVAKKFPDQFAPFLKLEKDLNVGSIFSKDNRYCNGSIVAVPLRTADSTKHISDEILERSKWAEMVAEWWKDAHLFLLFAHKISDLQVSEIPAESCGATPIAKAVDYKCTKTVLAQTSSSVAPATDGARNPSDAKPSPGIDSTALSRVRITADSNSNELRKNEVDYFLRAAADKQTEVAVAITGNGPKGGAVEASGRVFCGQTLHEVYTGCSVHVNGRFCPRKDRKSLLLEDEDLPFANVEKNREMLQRAGGEIATLLRDLNAQQQPASCSAASSPTTTASASSRSFRLDSNMFPRFDHESQKPTAQNFIAAGFFWQAKNLPAMHRSICDEVLQSFGDYLFLRGGAATRDKRCGDAMKVLRKLNAPVCELPDHVYDEYFERGIVERRCEFTRDRVFDWLRKLQPARLESLAQNDLGDLVDYATEGRGKNAAADTKKLLSGCRLNVLRDGTRTEFDAEDPSPVCETQQARALVDALKHNRTADHSKPERTQKLLAAGLLRTMHAGDVKEAFENSEKSAAQVSALFRWLPSQNSEEVWDHLGDKRIVPVHGESGVVEFVTLGDGRRCVSEEFRKWRSVLERVHVRVVAEEPSRPSTQDQHGSEIEEERTSVVRGPDERPAVSYNSGHFRAAVIHRLSWWDSKSLGSDAGVAEKLQNGLFLALRETVIRNATDHQQGEEKAVTAPASVTVRLDSADVAVPLQRTLLEKIAEMVSQCPSLHSLAEEFMLDLPLFETWAQRTPEAERTFVALRSVKCVFCVPQNASHYWTFVRQTVATESAGRAIVGEENESMQRFLREILPGDAPINHASPGAYVTGDAKKVFLHARAPLSIQDVRLTAEAIKKNIFDKDALTDVAFVPCVSGKFVRMDDCLLAEGDDAALCAGVSSSLCAAWQQDKDLCRQLQAYGTGLRKEPTRAERAEILEQLFSGKNTAICTLDMAFRTYNGLDVEAAERFSAERKPWIWTEAGWKSEAEVSVEDGADVLKPYLHPLPGRFHKLNIFENVVQRRRKGEPEALVEVLEAVKRDMMSGNASGGVEVVGENKMLPIAQYALTRLHGKLDEVKKAEGLFRRILLPTKSQSLLPAASVLIDDKKWRDDNFHVGAGRSAAAGATVAGMENILHELISPETGLALGADRRSKKMMEKYGSRKIQGVKSVKMGQPLEKRISDICNDYPPKFCVRELLQNADDAGATEFFLIWDRRRCWKDAPDSSLLSTEMAAFQGPAVYAYNDAPFSDADFNTLAQIGESTKAGNGLAIGKHGVGFKSVFHLTDLPSIWSRYEYLFLDPLLLALHGQDVSKDEPGLRFGHAENQPHLEMKDQFEPYQNIAAALQLPRSHGDGYLDGSLIRAPLRDASRLGRAGSKGAVAGSSSSSSGHASGAEAGGAAAGSTPRINTDFQGNNAGRKEVFDFVKGQAAAMLLMLQNVRQFRLFEFSDDEDGPKLLHQVERDISADGKEVFLKVSSAAEAGIGSVGENHAPQVVPERVLPRLERNGVKIVEDRRVPAGGQFYCGLPAEKYQTGIDAHLHAMWHMSKDRRTILFDENEDAAAVQKNRILADELGDALAVFCAERGAATSQTAVHLFPGQSAQSGERLQFHITERFYQKVAAANGNEACFYNIHGQRISGSLRRCLVVYADTGEQPPDAAREQLLGDPAICVALGIEVLRLPRLVVERLRKVLGGADSLQELAGTSLLSRLRQDQIASPLGDHAVRILAFCSSDLETDWTLLEGCKLRWQRDGAIGAFRKGSPALVPHTSAQTGIWERGWDFLNCFKTPSILHEGFSSEVVKQLVESKFARRFQIEDVADLYGQEPQPPQGNDAISLTERALSFWRWLEPFQRGKTEVPLDLLNDFPLLIPANGEQLLPLRARTHTVLLPADASASLRSALGKSSVIISRRDVPSSMRQRIRDGDVADDQVYGNALLMALSDVSGPAAPPLGPFTCAELRDLRTAVFKARPLGSFPAERAKPLARSVCARWPLLETLGNPASEKYKILSPGPDPALQGGGVVRLLPSAAPEGGGGDDWSSRIASIVGTFRLAGIRVPDVCVERDEGAVAFLEQTYGLSEMPQEEFAQLVLRKVREFPDAMEAALVKDVCELPGAAETVQKCEEKFLRTRAGEYRAPKEVISPLVEKRFPHVALGQAAADDMCETVKNCLPDACFRGTLKDGEAAHVADYVESNKCRETAIALFKYLVDKHAAFAQGQRKEMFATLRQKRWLPVMQRPPANEWSAQLPWAGDVCFQGDNGGLFRVGGGEGGGGSIFLERVLPRAGGHAAGDDVLEEEDLVASCLVGYAYPLLEPGLMPNKQHLESDSNSFLQQLGIRGKIETDHILDSVEELSKLPEAALCSHAAAITACVTTLYRNISPTGNDHVRLCGADFVWIPEQTCFVKRSAALRNNSVAGLKPYLCSLSEAWRDYPVFGDCGKTVAEKDVLSVFAIILGEPENAHSMETRRKVCDAGLLLLKDDFSVSRKTKVSELHELVFATKGSGDRGIFSGDRCYVDNMPWLKKDSPTVHSIFDSLFEVEASAENLALYFGVPTATQLCVEEFKMGRSLLDTADASSESAEDEEEDADEMEVDESGNDDEGEEESSNENEDEGEGGTAHAANHFAEVLPASDDVKNMNSTALFRHVVNLSDFWVDACCTDHERPSPLTAINVSFVPANTTSTVGPVPAGNKSKGGNKKGKGRANAQLAQPVEQGARKGNGGPVQRIFADLFEDLSAGTFQIQLGGVTSLTDQRWESLCSERALFGDAELVIIVSGNVIGFIDPSGKRLPSLRYQDTREPMIRLPLDVFKILFFQGVASHEKEHADLNRLKELLFGEANELQHTRILKFHSEYCPAAMRQNFQDLASCLATNSMIDGQKDGDWPRECLEACVLSSSCREIRVCFPEQQVTSGAGPPKGKGAVRSASATSSSNAGTGCSFAVSSAAAACDSGRASSSASASFASSSSQGGTGFQLQELVTTWSFSNQPQHAVRSFFRVDKGASRLVFPADATFNHRKLQPVSDNLRTVTLAVGDAWLLKHGPKKGRDGVVEESAKLLGLAVAHRCNRDADLSADLLWTKLPLEDGGRSMDPFTAGGNYDLTEETSLHFCSALLQHVHPRPRGPCSSAGTALPLRDYKLLPKAPASLPDSAAARRWLLEHASLVALPQWLDKVCACHTESFEKSSKRLPAGTCLQAADWTEIVPRCIPEQPAAPSGSPADGSAPAPMLKQDVHGELLRWLFGNRDHYANDDAAAGLPRSLPLWRRSGELSGGAVKWFCKDADSLDIVKDKAPASSIVDLSSCHVPHGDLIEFLGLQRPEIIADVVASTERSSVSSAAFWRYHCKNGSFKDTNWKSSLSDLHGVLTLATARYPDVAVGEGVGNMKGKQGSSSSRRGGGKKGDQGSAPAQQNEEVPLQPYCAVSSLEEVRKKHGDACAAALQQVGCRFNADPHFPNNEAKLYAGCAGDFIAQHLGGLLTAGELNMTAAAAELLRPLLLKSAQLGSATNAAKKCVCELPLVVDTRPGGDGAETTTSLLPLTECLFVDSSTFASACGALGLPVFNAQADEYRSLNLTRVDPLQVLETHAGRIAAAASTPAELIVAAVEWWPTGDGVRGRNIETLAKLRLFSGGKALTQLWDATAPNSATQLLYEASPAALQSSFWAVPEPQIIAKHTRKLDSYQNLLDFYTAFGADSFAGIPGDKHAQFRKSIFDSLATVFGVRSGEQRQGQQSVVGQEGEENEMDVDHEGDGNGGTSSQEERSAQQQSHARVLADTILLPSGQPPAASWFKLSELFEAKSSRPLIDLTDLARTKMVDLVFSDAAVPEDVRNAIQHMFCTQPPPHFLLSQLIELSSARAEGVVVAEKDQHQLVGLYRAFLRSGICEKAPLAAPASALSDAERKKCKPLITKLQKKACVFGVDGVLRWPARFCLQLEKSQEPLFALPAELRALDASLWEILKVKKKAPAAGSARPAAVDLAERQRQDFMSEHPRHSDLRILVKDGRAVHFYQTSWRLAFDGAVAGASSSSSSASAASSALSMVRPIRKGTKTTPLQSVEVDLSAYSLDAVQILCRYVLGEKLPSTSIADDVAEELKALGNLLGDAHVADFYGRLLAP